VLRVRCLVKRFLYLVWVVSLLISKKEALTFPPNHQRGQTSSSTAEKKKKNEPETFPGKNNHKTKSAAKKLPKKITRTSMHKTSLARIGEEKPKPNFEDPTQKKQMSVGGGRPTRRVEQRQGGQSGALVPPTECKKTDKTNAQTGLPPEPCLLQLLG